MSERGTRHTEFQVHLRSFGAAMAVFELSKQFPRDEIIAMLVARIHPPIPGC